MHLPNVTLLTSAKVTKIVTNATGTAATFVEVQHNDPASDRPELATYFGNIIAVCCGAINSAALLLQSATAEQPRGLANSSDMVGRHFMYHQADAVLSLSFHRNDDSYMKTWGTNDFYFRDPNGGYDFPMGSVQPIGSFHHEMMKGDAPPLTPGFVLETMKISCCPLVAHDRRPPRPEQPCHARQPP